MEAVVRAALGAGWEASLFLMDEGVAYAADGSLLPLLQAGADAVVCAMDAEARGVDLAAIRRRVSSWALSTITRAWCATVIASCASRESHVPGQRRRSSPELHMRGMGDGRRVVVLLRHPAAHRKTEQGLRAAVGYLTVGLPVTVLLSGAAATLLTETVVDRRGDTWRRCAPWGRRSGCTTTAQAGSLRGRGRSRSGRGRGPACSRRT